MCNKCGKNALIRVGVTPIVINFSVAIQKNGKTKRTTDFEAKQTFEPDAYLTNNYEAVCTNCGTKVDFSELKIAKTCESCDNTRTKFCAYNNVEMCESCAAKYLHYCRKCPFFTDCALGAKNVNRNS